MFYIKIIIHVSHHFPTFATLTGWNTPKNSIEFYIKFLPWKVLNSLEFCVLLSVWTLLIGTSCFKVKREANSGNRRGRRFWKYLPLCPSYTCPVCWTIAEPNVKWLISAGAFPSFCSIRHLGVSLPLDGMLAHRLLAPQWYPFILLDREKQVE
jgi:hypothetical protein